MNPYYTEITSEFPYSSKQATEASFIPNPSSHIALVTDSCVKDRIPVVFECTSLPETGWAPPPKQNNLTQLFKLLQLCSPQMPWLQSYT